MSSPARKAPRARESPSRLRHRRRAQPNGEGNQQEQLLVVRAGHPGQERRDDLEGEVTERDQDGRRLRERPSKGEEPLAPGCPQHRDEHRQDDHRQVLNQG